MSEETVIRVNFGRPIPLFPLPAVALMPHGVLPLHIFEQRYRQMVNDVLDTNGQIAMAVYSTDGDDEEDGEEGDADVSAAATAGTERMAIRPVVCIGQVLQHKRYPDGRYDIILQGVCRAKIVHEMPPAEDRLYREAMLEPVGLERINESSLSGFRGRVTEMLGEAPLTDLRDSESVLQYVRNQEIPTSAILELITLSFINDNETRYRLLAMPDVRERARMVETELSSIQKLLKQAQTQRDVKWPKGCSWN